MSVICIGDMVEFDEASHCCIDTTHTLPILIIYKCFCFSFCSLICYCIFSLFNMCTWERLFEGDATASTATKGQQTDARR